tara:strand:- start:13 stop:591 length:579 start_codon:yes stop_codon:yes gene_type:complete
MPKYMQIELPDTPDGAEIAWLDSFTLKLRYFAEDRTVDVTVSDLEGTHLLSESFTAPPNVDPEADDGSIDPDDADAYCAARDAIAKRIADALFILPEDLYVVYSAYQADENDVPIDNLDDIAIPMPPDFDTIMLCAEYGEARKTYREPVTWLQVAMAAQEFIVATGDLHHVFLEGVRTSGDGEGVWCVSMGS